MFYKIHFLSAAYIDKSLYQEALAALLERDWTCALLLPGSVLAIKFHELFTDIFWHNFGIHFLGYWLNHVFFRWVFSWAVQRDLRDGSAAHGAGVRAHVLNYWRWLRLHLILRYWLIFWSGQLFFLLFQLFSRPSNFHWLFFCLGIFSLVLSLWFRLWLRLLFGLRWLIIDLFDLILL